MMKKKNGDGVSKRFSISEDLSTLFEAMLDFKSVLMRRFTSTK
jgi:hypothetical protein